MMEELVVQLLKENGRVILPEFGALIVKTKSPFKVIFNEFLQYNDGALIGATAKSENIEREDAARKVKEFVSKIISDLDHGKQINLGEVGVLSKSSTGKISLEDGGEQATKKEEEPKAEATKDAVEFDLSETEQPKPTPTPKPKPAEPKKTTEVKKEAPVKNSPVEQKKKEMPTTPKQEFKKKEPVTKEPMPIDEFYEEDNSRKKLNYIIWGIIIIIVNGAIIGYFLFDDEIKSMFAKNKTEQSQSIETPAITTESDLEVETPAEEELVIEDDTEEEIQALVETKEIIGKKYYVVAGVFKDENNADNLVITLKNQGYNAEKFGKIGALHAVCYDVFPTKQEADAYMLKLKKEVDSETWIKVVE